MGNLFAGLESLGLNIKDDVDVYEKEKKEILKIIKTISKRKGC